MGNMTAPTGRIPPAAHEDGNGSLAGYSSPPCFMHELDPRFLGYMSRVEVLALLDQLLEGERAGARGVGEMSGQAPSVEARTALREIARDEARFCAMLIRHIARLGGTPSRLTGAFHKKLAAVEALDERLDLLNRGQGWVARRLREAIPGIADDLLRADLQEMLAVHLRNIERCTQLKGGSDARPACSPEKGDRSYVEPREPASRFSKKEC
jgi:nitronate monooxygenase